MSPILLWHDFVIGPSDSAWSCVLRRSSAGKLCPAPWWKMDEEAVRHENGREEKAFFMLSLLCLLIIFVPGSDRL